MVLVAAQASRSLFTFIAVLTALAAAASLGAAVFGILAHRSARRGWAYYLDQLKKKSPKERDRDLWTSFLGGTTLEKEKGPQSARREERGPWRLSAAFAELPISVYASDPAVRRLVDDLVEELAPDVTPPPHAL